MGRALVSRNFATAACWIGVLEILFGTCLALCGFIEMGMFHRLSADGFWTGFPVRFDLQSIIDHSAESVELFEVLQVVFARSFFYFLIEFLINFAIILPHVVLNVVKCEACAQSLR